MSVKGSVGSWVADLTPNVVRRVLVAAGITKLRDKMDTFALDKKQPHDTAVVELGIPKNDFVERVQISPCRLGDKPCSLIVLACIICCNSPNKQPGLWDAIMPQYIL
jgi:hypothetical protein